MADPSQLPHELVLLFIEAACHMYVYSRAGWVASLCLVCKSVQNVVNPILYARLFIGEHNIAALDKLSRSGNSNRLSLVREVFIDLHSSFGDDRDGDCIVSARFAFLARALIGVRVISGPSRTIEALSHWNPCLRRQLVSVFVTDTTDSWHATTDKHCFAPVLRSVDYLHIIIFMGATIDSPGDLAFLRGAMSTAHFLIFDLLSQDRELIATLKVESLILTLENIVSSLSPTFQRLVLRPRCVFEESVRFITARLAAWAKVKRDPRIFVDDDFVPILDEETTAGCTRRSIQKMHWRARRCGSEVASYGREAVNKRRFGERSFFRRDSTLLTTANRFNLEVRRPVEAHQQSRPAEALCPSRMLLTQRDDGWK